MVTNANEVQMARRMKFSVVGLPHYTIWHLYEPSVDDLRHMEEMEQERLAREQEETERAGRKESPPQDHVADNVGEQLQGSAEGPAAHPAKDESPSDSSKQAEQAAKIEAQ